jgi:hypothetical protein
VRPYYDADGVTIYHGDAREVAAWLAADVLVVDPPYGMEFVSAWTEARPIAGDADTATRDAILAAWGDRPAAVFGTWKVPRPPETRAVIVWDKTDGVGPGMGDLGSAFGTSHEEVYLLGEWPKQAKRRGSVIRTACGMGSLTTAIGHPTPKPIGPMEQIIAAAPPGVIADPCCGSGSTLVAAKNLGRRAIGVELHERYCEVAATRLSQGVLDLGGVA